jgi:DNA ligase (NAD+)
MSIPSLVKRLAEASAAYHNGQALLMTDEEFDAGIDQLRALDPHHPFLTEVGAPITAGDEVALPYPLPSLNKIKPDGTLEKWVKRYSAPSYHISVKLDGCSALWIPHAGKLYTRGDGMRGRDISAFVPYFKGLKKTVEPYIVRGELIMRTDSPMIPAGKLARNIVAGALNRKATEIDTTLFNDIEFIAYELIEPALLAPEDAYKRLRMAGFDVARSVVTPVTEMTADRLSQTFSNAEGNSPYQLDGIVVAPNIARRAPVLAVRKGTAVNPDDRVAWKTRLTAATARTTVRTVEWNVSASGMMIPRVLFDPVTLAGANIGAATGLHGRWIYDNKVGPGAVIEVRRAGDVIPQIIAVHSAAPGGAAMPSGGYDWDGAVHIKPAEGSVSVEAACIQLTRGLAELGVENVGPGMVAKLYEAGFTTIGRIYGATAAEFSANVAGCKDKMGERMYDGLRVKQSAWTELDIICASCTMPRGVSRTKLKPLLSLEANPQKWTLARLSPRPEGLSTATIESIIAAVPAYIEWRTANFPGFSVITPPPETPVVSTSNVPPMSVVLTGFRDKALEEVLKGAGHTVSDSVTKKTTFVVYPDGPLPSSTKITKAQALCIRVIPVSVLRGMLKPASLTE